MNNPTDKQPSNQQMVFRPSLAFYHPKPSGAGSALKLELHPAHDQIDGSIWATIAPQVAKANLNAPTPTYARFGWENAIVTKLDFNDLTKMLMVFRGEQESIEDGMGLIHKSPKGTTRIQLRHLCDIKDGYSLEFYRTAVDRTESSAHIFLTRSEALGLVAAIESSFGVICFGIPMVIQRDTSAYRAAQKEIRNAPAA